MSETSWLRTRRAVSPLTRRPSCPAMHDSADELRNKNFKTQSLRDSTLVTLPLTTGRTAAHAAASPVTGAPMMTTFSTMPLFSLRDAISTRQ